MSSAVSSEKKRKQSTQTTLAHFTQHSHQQHSAHFAPADGQTPSKRVKGTPHPPSSSDIARSRSQPSLLLSPTSSLICLSPSLSVCAVHPSFLYQPSTPKSSPSLPSSSSTAAEARCRRGRSADLHVLFSLSLCRAEMSLNGTSNGRVGGAPSLSSARSVSLLRPAPALLDCVLRLFSHIPWPPLSLFHCSALASRRRPLRRRR